MSQLKDIKERIESVKKTRKMTQAMKMVAAAKFKRFSNQAVSSRTILTELDSNLNQLTAEIGGPADSDYARPVESNTELVLVIAGDKGLCGGFNTNILKSALKYTETSKCTQEFILFGKKSIQFFKNKNFNVVDTYEQFQDTLTVEKIQKLMSTCLEFYKSGQYSRVLLIYNEFKTAVSTNLIQKQLLPIPCDINDDPDVELNIFVEPSLESVFDTLAKSYIQNSLFNSFLESVAAEQGARMAAMDAATDNAADMISDLSLIYNRQRQAQITTELTEIVAGAEALVN